MQTIKVQEFNFGNLRNQLWYAVYPLPDFLILKLSSAFLAIVLAEFVGNNNFIGICLANSTRVVINSILRFSEIFELFVESEISICCETLGSSNKINRLGFAGTQGLSHFFKYSQKLLSKSSTLSGFSWTAWVSAWVSPFGDFLAIMHAIEKPFISRSRAQEGVQFVVVESKIMIAFGSSGASRVWKCPLIRSAAGWRWIIRHWFNLFLSLKLPCMATAKAWKNIRRKIDLIRRSCGRR